jgi:glyoxylase-like metal-dependent hydrolase (beta-lactamase superfamily II)
MGFTADEHPWEGGRVSSRVLCLRANNPSGMTYVGTNTWLVAEPGAAKCVVIDPAPAGGQVQRILATCQRHGWEVGAIVATHDHPDHIEGIPELAAATGTPVFAARHREIAKLPGAGDVTLLGLGRGRFVPFEGSPAFEVIPLPGHSTDSVGLLLPAEKALFTGDVLFRHGPTVVFYPDGVLGNYYQTLNTLQQLVRYGEAVKFYPGHGYPITDPLQAIEATREHRDDRLQQVCSAIDAGTPADPEALYEVVYAGTDPSVKFAAIRSIQAQLEYLGKLPN